MRDLRVEMTRGGVPVDGQCPDCLGVLLPVCALPGRRRVLSNWPPGCLWRRQPRGWDGRPPPADLMTAPGMTATLSSQFDRDARAHHQGSVVDHRAGVMYHTPPTVGGCCPQRASGPLGLSTVRDLGSLSSSPLRQRERAEVMRMRRQDALGKQGEQLAAEYLERVGEIDIVAADRSDVRLWTPVEALTSEKLRLLQHLAVQWVLAHGLTFDGLRVDIVGVLRSASGDLTMEHVRGVG